MHAKLIVLTAAAALAGAAFASTAAFAGIGEELTVAQTHALLAYRSGGRGERGIATAQTHLHHVINCLVGPGGAGYDVTPPLMDPCAADKSNKGALNDATSAGQKQKIQAAIDLAKANLAITDNAKLQEQTTALADAIGAAKE
jgi:hypothetical protein